MEIVYGQFKLFYSTPFRLFKCSPPHFLVPNECVILFIMYFVIAPNANKMRIHTKIWDLIYIKDLPKIKTCRLDLRSNNSILFRDTQN